MNERLSMFAGTADKFIQCVICSSVKGQFEALGFVDNVDKLKSTEEAKTDAGLSGEGDQKPEPEAPKQEPEEHAKSGSKK